MRKMFFHHSPAFCGGIEGARAHFILRVVALEKPGARIYIEGGLRP